MKILAGAFKNRRLFLPKDYPIRPTSGLLRAALFNICQQIIEGAHFLDLFCGSGAIGIEAISRGAAHCTFIDNDLHLLSYLRKTITTLGVEEQATLICKDAYQILPHQPLSQHSQPISIVYIDPPYASIEGLNSLLKALANNPLVAPQASIFIETRKNSFEPSTDASLHVIKKRTYSDTALYECVYLS